MVVPRPRAGSGPGKYGGSHLGNRGAYGGGNGGKRRGCAGCLAPSILLAFLLLLGAYLYITRH